jgi:serine/threonine protein kinase/tetratricopeptide (TPR) repeat protein
LVSFERVLTVRAEEWERIKQLFEAALQLPPSERVAYVEKHCADDPQILETVLELLSNHPSNSLTLSAGAASQVSVLAPGELIAGRFRIIRHIASGGMGEVYEAFDERLHLRLALKTLRLELLSEKGALKRFEQEIRLARDVSHENVCRVYDLIEHAASIGSQDRRIIPCLTMELLEGESLSSSLSRLRPIPTNDALIFIQQIAAGIDVLHDYGIIHRDLKPSNIMLVRKKNGQLRVVVTDFGLAKLDDREGDLAESYSRFRVGAPFYMAPELLKTGRPSVASDIYAFGLIIDEMVTREKAYPARSLPELFYSKIWEGPLHPAKRAERLPIEWQQTILRCLSASPEERFDRASAVVRALTEPVTAVAIPSPPKQTELVTLDSQAPVVDVRRPRFLTRRATLAVVVALPALSGVGAMVLAFRPLTTSIDVYDVANETRQSDYEYFCNGTTSELLRRLTHLDGVRVIPLRTTRSKAPARKPSRFALDGALVANRQKVALSVLLTDTSDGSLVWSDRFEGKKVDDPLELQAEIANRVVTAIENKAFRSQTWAYDAGLRIRRLFKPPMVTQVAATPTRSNYAFDRYMRGRQLLEEVSADSARAAVDYFQQSLKEDPTFALAYAALAEAYIAEMNYNVAPDQTLLNKAREYAEQSVQNDRNLADGYAVLGAVRQMTWDWEGAESSYRNALTLKPNFPRARRWYAGLILQFGRFSDALAQTREALEQDPYDRAAPTSYGFFLLMSGRCEEAIHVLERSVEGREAAGARRNLGQAYARLAYLSSGETRAQYFRKAFAQAEQVAASEKRAALITGVEQRPSLASEMYALFYSIAGDFTSAAPYVEQLKSDLAAGLASPVTLAWMYAIQGRRAEAMDQLERAATFKDRRLLYTKISPFLENLRGEPRFQSLLRTMRL